MSPTVTVTLVVLAWILSTDRLRRALPLESLTAFAAAGLAMVILLYSRQF